VATLDGRRRVAVLVAKHRRVADRDRWEVQMHLNPRPDWELVACENPDGDGIRDYWLVSKPGPHVSIGVRHRRARLWIGSGSLEALLGRLLGEVRPQPHHQCV
jgi:hypothetical protein